MVLIVSEDLLRRFIYNLEISLKLVLFISDYKLIDVIIGSPMKLFKDLFFHPFFTVECL